MFSNGDLRMPDFVSNGHNCCYTISSLHFLAASTSLTNQLTKCDAQGRPSLARRFVNNLLRWRQVFLESWLQKQTRSKKRHELSADIKALGVIRGQDDNVKEKNKSSSIALLTLSLLPTDRIATTHRKFG